MATKMTEKELIVRREFIAPLGFLNVRLIIPQEGGPAPRNPLLEFAERSFSVGALVFV
jgi:hypothetical protein